MTTKVPTRQITSGSATSGQVLTADGAGGVAYTKISAAKHVFSGYRTAGNVAAVSKFICNVAEVNQGNVYDTSTGNYTVPETGVYEVSGDFCSADTNAAYLQIYVNGVALTNPSIAASSGSVHRILNLNEGDVVSFYSGPTAGRSIIGSGNYLNHFTIKQIG